MLEDVIAEQSRAHGPLHGTQMHKASTKSRHHKFSLNQHGIPDSFTAHHDPRHSRRQAQLL